MGLSDLLKPKWKHSNEKVRLTAIGNLTDQALLTEIAKNDDDDQVRMAAVEKLNDQAVLYEIANNDRRANVSVSAINKINDKTLLADIAKNSDHRPNVYADYDRAVAVGKAAVDKLTDQTQLSDIGKRAKLEKVAEAAVNKLSDQALLGDVAKNGSYSDVCREAVKKISDQALLVEIFKSEGAPTEGRIASLEKIKDRKVMAYVAKNSNDNYLLEKIAAKLTDQEALEYLAKKTINNKEDLNRAERIRIIAADRLSNRFLAQTVYADMIIIEDYLYHDDLKELMAKITDQTILADIAKNSKLRTGFIAKAAVEKINDESLLFDIAMNAPLYIDSVGEALGPDYYGLKAITSYKVSLIAVDKINNQNLIREIAETNQYPRARLAAADKLDDKLAAQTVYADIAKNQTDYPHGYEYDSCVMATKKITDQSLLSEIAMHSKCRNARIEAIKELEDRSSLSEMAKKEDEDRSVRDAAQERLRLLSSC